MRHMVILLLAVFAGSFAEAQKLTDRDIPAPAKQTFAQKFPNATNVKWEKEDDAIEAEFKIGKSKYSASFDQAGKWLETESEIKKSELPEAVLSAITKEFSGYKIEEAERLETPDLGILYEVKLEKKEISYEVQFNEAGKVLKKEKVEENNEKEKD